MNMDMRVGQALSSAPLGLLQPEVSQEAEETRRSRHTMVIGP